MTEKIVRAPGCILNERVPKSPVVRLLEGIDSILAARFRRSGDVVPIDLVTPTGDPARPEWVGCHTNDVVTEAIRSMSADWIVTPIRFGTDDPPYRLIVQAKESAPSQEGGR